MSVSQVTWQDVQQAPDDGKRREAIGGELYVTPAPSVRHQRISGRLETALRRLLEVPGHGEVLHAPIGVEFPATGEGVREYWIVDPDGDAVDVWTFGEDDESPRHERVTDRLPVRIGAETVGEVDLEAVFHRG